MTSAIAAPEKNNEKEPGSAQVQEEEMLEDPLDEETNEEKSGQNGAADRATTAQTNQNHQDDEKTSTANLTPEEINKRSIWIRGISKDTTAASLKVRQFRFLKYGREDWERFVTWNTAKRLGILNGR